VIIRSQELLALKLDHLPATDYGSLGTQDGVVAILVTVDLISLDYLADSLPRAVPHQHRSIRIEAAAATAAAALTTTLTVAVTGSGSEVSVDV
jgi:hypothetical protein